MEKINNSSSPRPHILIAPLNWGLGHATRCIPLIKELIAYRCEVSIAASGASAALLKKEFSHLNIILLKDAPIRYARNKRWLPMLLLFQFPLWYFRCLQEHRWLKRWVKKNRIDAIISDNRPGCYHKKVPGYYITHQLKIKAGNRLAEWLMQKIHYFFINKYQACWVPDAAGKENLAGELSHPSKLPRTPITYLGALSRLEKSETTNKYYLLVLISGPEPQRSIFEKIILTELKNYAQSVLVLRGLPDQTPIPLIENDQITIVNHLSTHQINEAINESQLIISRSGYTTIMDIVKLKKKALLIPTPGQTEQEYLAKYLSEKKYFFSVKQSDFSLKEAIKMVEGNAFSFPDISMQEYKKGIQQLLANLNN